MSLVGLGSVSDYCLHQLHVPVIVVHHDAAATPSADMQGDSAIEGKQVNQLGSIRCTKCKSPLVCYRSVCIWLTRWRVCEYMGSMSEALKHQLGPLPVAHSILSMSFGK